MLSSDLYVFLLLKNVLGDVSGKSIGYLIQTTSMKAKRVYPMSWQCSCEPVCVGEGLGGPKGACLRRFGGMQVVRNEFF